MALLESQHGPSSTPPDGNPSVAAPPRFRTPVGTLAPPLSRGSGASVDAAFEDELDDADAFDGDPDAPVATFVMERGEMERRVSAVDFANPQAAGYHVHDGARPASPGPLNGPGTNANVDARASDEAAHSLPPVTPGYQVLPTAPGAGVPTVAHAPFGAASGPLRPQTSAMATSAPTQPNARVPRARTGTLLAAQGASVAPVSALPPPIPAPRTNHSIAPSVPGPRVNAGTALPMPLAPAPLTPAPPTDLRPAPVGANPVDPRVPLFGSALAPGRAGLPAPSGAHVPMPYAQPAAQALYGRATSHGAVSGRPDALAWGAPNAAAGIPAGTVAPAQAPSVATVNVSPGRGGASPVAGAPAATALGWQGQTAMGRPSYQPAPAAGHYEAMGPGPAENGAAGEHGIAMGQHQIGQPSEQPALPGSQVKTRRGATLLVHYWYPLFILLVAGFFAAGYAYFAAQDAKRARTAGATKPAVNAADGAGVAGRESPALTAGGEGPAASPTTDGGEPTPVASATQPAVGGTPTRALAPGGTDPIVPSPPPPASSALEPSVTAAPIAVNRLDAAEAQGPSPAAAASSVSGAAAAAKVAPIVAQPVVTPPHGTTEVSRTGAQVVFESQPPGAYVTLIANGQSQGIGKTPVASYVDPNSKYEVVFALDGHRTKVASLNPKRSKAVSVRLSAQRDDVIAAPAAPSRSVVRAKTGTLMINAKPPCEIYVDGRATGLYTPQRDVVVTAGTHTITLVNKQAGIRKQIAVSVAEGKNTKIVQDYTAIGQ